jgi:hypothetical protein
MLVPEGNIEASLRNIVAAIAAALYPCPMVSVPIARLALLPAPLLLPSLRLLSCALRLLLLLMLGLLYWLLVGLPLRWLWVGGEPVGLLGLLELLGSLFGRLLVSLLGLLLCWLTEIDGHAAPQVFFAAYLNG